MFEYTNLFFYLFSMIAKLLVLTVIEKNTQDNIEVFFSFFLALLHIEQSKQCIEKNAKNWYFSEFKKKSSFRKASIVYCYNSFVHSVVCVFFSSFQMVCSFNSNKEFFVSISIGNRNTRIQTIWKRFTLVFS